LNVDEQGLTAGERNRVATNQWNEYNRIQKLLADPATAADVPAAHRQWAERIGDAIRANQATHLQENTPNQGAGEVREIGGKLWTKDANGNIIPYTGR
jgi:hypothetical protein